MLSVNCDFVKVKGFRQSTWVCSDTPTTFQVQTDLKPKPPSVANVTVKDSGNGLTILQESNTNDILAPRGSYVTVESANLNGTFRVVDYDFSNDFAVIDAEFTLPDEVGEAWQSYSLLTLEVVVTYLQTDESVSFRVPFDKTGLAQVDVSKYIRSFLTIDYEYDVNDPIEQVATSMWGSFNIEAREIEIASDGVQYFENVLDTINVPDGLNEISQNRINSDRLNGWAEFSPSNPNAWVVADGSATWSPTQADELSNVLFYEQGGTFLSSGFFSVFVKLSFPNGTGAVELAVLTGETVPIGTQTVQRVIDSSEQPDDLTGYYLLGSIPPVTSIYDFSAFMISAVNRAGGADTYVIEDVQLRTVRERNLTGFTADVSRNLIGNQFGCNNIERVGNLSALDALYLVSDTTAFHTWGDPLGLYINLERYAQAESDANAVFIEVYEGNEITIETALPTVGHIIPIRTGQKSIVNGNNVLDVLGQSVFESATKVVFTPFDTVLGEKVGRALDVFPQVECGFSTLFSFVNDIGGWEWVRLYHKRDETIATQPVEAYGVEQFQLCDEPFTDGSYVEAFSKVNFNRKRLIAVKTKKRELIAKIARLRVSPRVQVFEQQGDGQGLKWLSCRIEKGTILQWKDSKGFLNVSFSYELPSENTITT